MHGFTFRIGMKFPETRRLITEGDQLLLHEDENEVVWLAAATAIQIRMVARIQPGSGDLGTEASGTLGRLTPRSC